jgi:tetratricopeptide (TPR) repeat protein
MPSPIDRSDPNFADKYGVTVKKIAVQSCQNGDKLLKDGEYEGAKSAYQIAIECEPKLAIAHSGLARAYYQLQDYPAALASCNLAIEYDLNCAVDYYYQRALIAYALGDYAVVLADCDRVLTQVPDYDPARWLLTIALVKAKDYRMAISKLIRHILLCPDDPYGYWYRGICYERLDRPEAALADFDRAIAIDPKEPIFYRGRGRIYQQLGNLTAALSDYNLTIAMKSHRASIYTERAEIHRLQDNYELAIADWTQAIEVDPQALAAYFQRGLAHLELGKSGAAIADFERVIALDPQHQEAYIQRQWYYFRQGNYDLAVQNCQDVLGFDPTCYRSNYLLGVIYAGSGLVDYGIDYLTRSIESVPDYVSAIYYRGITYYAVGKIPQASIDFERAITIQDRTVDAIASPTMEPHQQDETALYAEGLARYHHTKHITAARRLLDRAALTAQKFNNQLFRQTIAIALKQLPF